MRCLTCQYDLKNLSAGVHRCPECGRIFDAADPQTYTTESGPKYLEWIALMAISIVVAVLTSLLAVWIKRTFF